MNDNGSRQSAIANVQTYFNSGCFVKDLAALVAVETESQRPEARAALYDYLNSHIAQKLDALGFHSELFDNPVAAGGPLLICERIEDERLPTVLIYGHGDVVVGQESEWDDGLSPWQLTVKDGQIYGRGTADNKGQHLIAIEALRTVIAERGRLGFNCRVLIEMSEEIGSPGLQDFCRTHSDRLKGDVLIASDGPRLVHDQAAIVLGSRGSIRFNLTVEARDVARHSGNWGGLLVDPAQVLVHALATIADRRGQIKISEWRPPPPSDGVRDLIQACTGPEVLDPSTVDKDWGEESLSPGERLLGWNSFAVLALELGDPARPVNAIQPKARACCQLRFVRGTNSEDILPALRRHLVAEGFDMVKVELDRLTYTNATRLDAGNVWAKWAIASVEETTGAKPHVVPNLGGTIPNHIFADDLGLATIWLPHSYAGCRQHAPGEHLLESAALEGLKIMTGLFWDLGEQGQIDAGAGGD
ncbi:MAG: M20 family metallopeptidase [Pseudomonadota bacterium]